MRNSTALTRDPKFHNGMKWADELDSENEVSAEEAELKEQIEAAKHKLAAKNAAKEAELKEKIEAAKQKLAAKEAAAKEADAKKAAEAAEAAQEEKIKALQKQLKELETKLDEKSSVWCDVVRSTSTQAPTRNTNAISDEFRRGSQRPDEKNTPQSHGCEKCGDKVQIYNGVPNPLCKQCYQTAKSTPDEDDVPYCGIKHCVRPCNVFHRIINFTCKPCWEKRGNCRAKGCLERVAFDRKHGKFFENCSRQCKNQPQSETHE
jgi:hypothetical protein